MILYVYCICLIHFLDTGHTIRGVPWIPMTRPGSVGDSPAPFATFATFSMMFLVALPRHGLSNLMVWSYDHFIIMLLLSFEIYIWRFSKMGLPQVTMALLSHDHSWRLDVLVPPWLRCNRLPHGLNRPHLRVDHQTWTIFVDTRPGKLTVCELETCHWNSGFSH